MKDLDVWTPRKDELVEQIMAHLTEKLAAYRDKGCKPTLSDIVVEDGGKTIVVLSSEGRPAVNVQVMDMKTSLVCDFNLSICEIAWHDGYFYFPDMATVYDVLTSRARAAPLIYAITFQLKTPMDVVEMMLRRISMYPSRYCAMRAVLTLIHAHAKRYIARGIHIEMDKTRTSSSLRGSTRYNVADDILEVMAPPRAPYAASEDVTPAQMRTAIATAIDKTAKTKRRIDDVLVDETSMDAFFDLFKDLSVTVTSE